MPGKTVTISGIAQAVTWIWRRTLGDEPSDAAAVPRSTGEGLMSTSSNHQPVQQISGSTGRRSSSALRWRLPCSGSSWWHLMPRS